MEKKYEIVDSLEKLNQRMEELRQAQRIYATYGIIAADNTEKTSSAYIYIVDSAVDVSPDDIDDPKIFARYVDCNMAGFGIYYSDSIYKNDLEYAKYLEEVCKVDNTEVEKSITVKRN